MTAGLFLRNHIFAQLPDVVREVSPERMMINNQIIDFDTSIPSYKRYYEYSILTHEGFAKIISNQADDIPRVSIHAEQRYGRLEEVGNGYAIGVREVEAAMAENVAIETEFLFAAKEAQDTYLEEVFYNGQPEFELQGFLNFPNVPLYTPPADGTGASTTLASKTASQNYRDLVTFANSRGQQTKGRFSIEYILCTIEALDYYANTLLDSNNAGGRTILQVFMDNQRLKPNGVKGMIPVPYLSGKGTAGTSIMIGYTRNSRYVVGMLPKYFNVEPKMHPVNRKFEVDIISCTGGTLVKQPLSMVKYDGQ